MSVRPVDRFISVMHRESAESILFDSGKKVRMRVGGGERILLAQEVRSDQIENLVAEIIPPDCRRNYIDAGETTFPYAAPTGPVVVRARRDGLRVEMQIVPYALAQRERANPAAEVIVPDARPVQGRPAGGGRMLARVETQKVPVRQAVDVDQEEPLELPLESVAPPAYLDPPILTRPRTPEPPRQEARPEPPRIEVVPLQPAPIGARSKLEQLLYALLEARGSDLHLRAGRPPVIRQDGELHPVPAHFEPLHGERVRDWVLEIAPPHVRAALELRSEVDFAYDLAGAGRFRVHVLRERGGLGASFRVVPLKAPTADQLGLADAVRALCSPGKGLVVVSGPLNSGKTTTVAALVDLINRSRRQHIVTLEDPIEYLHDPIGSLVTQREIGVHTTTLAAGLKSALREDPDVVVTGPLRDPESIALAVDCALRGLLVLGEHDALSAVAAIRGLIDGVGADRRSVLRYGLSRSLRGVLGQSLCRRAGGGRVLAQEVLLVNAAAAEQIAAEQYDALEAGLLEGGPPGQIGLLAALVQLVASGQIDPDEVLARAPAREAALAALEEAGFAIPLP